MVSNQDNLLTFVRLLYYFTSYNVSIKYTRYSVCRLLYYYSVNNMMMMMMMMMSCLLAEETTITGKLGEKKQ